MRNDSISSTSRWIAVFLVAALAGTAQARTASADEARSDTRPASVVQATGPWWGGFHEAALATLQRAALARSSAGGESVSGTAAMPLDAQVTVAYVAMRTFNVRWRLATDMRDTLDRQRKLLASAAPVASLGQALATIDGRRTKADRIAATLLGQRDAAIDALARLTGRPAQDLFGELQGALALRDMPVFDAETPERLPRSVLMARRDVSASRSMVALGGRSPEAQRQLAIGPASLAGWIAAVPDSLAATPSSELPDVQSLLTVAAQAETEISADLGALQRRTANTERLVGIVKSRQMELDAVKTRMQLGAASEHDVIQGYQALLVDDDELAVSAGELAYAWIKLQASTGGQAIQARVTPED